MFFKMRDVSGGWLIQARIWLRWGYSHATNLALLVEDNSLGYAARYYAENRGSDRREARSNS
jgi:hypothetical protein